VEPTQLRKKKDKDHDRPWVPARKPVPAAPTAPAGPAVPAAPACLPAGRRVSAIPAVINLPAATAPAPDFVQAAVGCVWTLARPLGVSALVWTLS